ncbi:MAG: photosystem II protein, Psb35-related [Actinomycetota bacterium]
MTIVISLLIVGWVAASVIGTQAYFRGEQSKPIHQRNWNSNSFEQLAESLTGNKIDYRDRTPAYSMDAYASNTQSNG